LNNPLKYTDPTGYESDKPGEGLPPPPYDGAIGWTSQDEWLIGYGGQWQQTASNTIDAVIYSDAVGIARGTGAFWFIVTHWPGVSVRNGVIYAPNKGGGSRYFHIDTHDLKGFKDVTHLNAEIGPLAKWNHTRLPSILKYGKSAAKGLVVVGAIIDMYDIGSSMYDDYQMEGQINFGPNTQDAVGRVAGGWAGALGGAAAGAAIGSAFAGVGAIPGAIIGGIIGGVGGGYLGGQVPGWLR
jgi:hypothetical protein